MPSSPGRLPTIRDRRRRGMVITHAVCCALRRPRPRAGEGLLATGLCLSGSRTGWVAQYPDRTKCKKTATGLHLYEVIVPRAEYRAPLQAGAYGAYEEVVLRESARLYALALTITRSPTEAEDVLQETLLSAWQSWGRLRDRSRAPSWLTRICVNKCLSQGRSTAQWHADRRARRPKTAKLSRHEPLRRDVQDRLGGVVTTPNRQRVPGPHVRWIGRRHGRRQHRRCAKAWSPEQIAKRLPIDFPDDESMRVSHEAIYQGLFVQGRGALRRELTAWLRSGRALCVPRARTRARGKHFVTDEIMISQRPAEVTDRAIQKRSAGQIPDTEG